MGLARVIRFIQKTFVALFPIFFLLFIVTSSISNTAQYIYDDLGRLSRVVDENGGYAAYEYDAVGNLISISNGTTQEAPPLLQSINPDIFFIDSTTSVVITGQNLLTTREITSDNPALIIRTFSVNDTSLKIEISVPTDALTGGANITVKTVYGSATIGITLLKLTFSPGQLALTPGSSGTITASVSSVIAKDMTFTINNDSPAVVSAPQSVTISSSGTATFNITALAEGVAILNSAGSKIVSSTIYVTQPFALEPGESVTSSTRPVSVYIKPPTSVDATTASLPVSVFIQPSYTVDATTASLPVSVFIQPSYTVDATTASLPVSVFIQPSLTIDATTASLPVSVYLQQPLAVDATVTSLPISTIISPP